MTISSTSVYPRTNETLVLFYSHEQETNSLLPDHSLCFSPKSETKRLTSFAYSFVGMENAFAICKVRVKVFFDALEHYANTLNLRMTAAT